MSITLTIFYSLTGFLLNFSSGLFFLAAVVILRETNHVALHLKYKNCRFFHVHSSLSTNKVDYENRFGVESVTFYYLCTLQLLEKKKFLLFSFSFNL